MEASEQAAVYRLVREHFSKATDGDGQIVWDMVKGYSLDHVRRAVKEHRIEKGGDAWRPHPRRIQSLAATYHNDARRERGDVKTVTWLRAEDKTGWTHGKCDRDVIVGHFVAAWEVVQASGERGIGFNVARAYVLAGARAALGQIGQTAVEVEAWARYCVGLEAGEKIPRGPLFQPDAPPPPPVYEAVKALARAELAGRKADRMTAAAFLAGGAT